LRRGYVDVNLGFSSPKQTASPRQKCQDDYDQKDNQHSYDAGATAAITVLGHNNPFTGNYALI
jgi:indole-3-glycerol phosphate synthase